MTNIYFKASKICQILIVALLLSFGNNSFAETNTINSDIRIIIDVSGSMTKNDPKNLRIPAINMISKLLPTGSRAGIWTFEDSVKNLVPLTVVDKYWSIAANKATEEISSSGSRTNLGKALEVGSQGWYRVNNNENRAIILLTDGLVDVSDDILLNDQERQRILSEVVPHLASVGVKVHTIALSDMADYKLMKDIAIGTDGLYQKAKSAEELQSIFLKIYEQIVDIDSLPFSENRFRVDNNIEQISLLIFNKDKSNPTKLKSPVERTYTANDKNNEISWYIDGDSELITINNPSRGNWQIEAKLGNDSRAFVASKLRLQIDKIPSNMFVGEKVEVGVSLWEQGSVVNNQEFLKYIDIYSELKISDENVMRFPFNDEGEGIDKKKQDGIYTSFIGPVYDVASDTLKELTIKVKGRTFEREQKKNIRVLPLPFKIKSETSIAKGGKSEIFVAISPDLNIVNSQTLEFKAEAIDNMGNLLRPEIYYQDGAWQMDLISGNDISEYKVRILATGKTITGREFSVVTEPLLVLIPEIYNPSVVKKNKITDDELFGKDEEESKELNIANDLVKKEGEKPIEISKEELDKVVSSDVAVEKNKTNKKAFIILMVLLGNLVVFGVGFMGFVIYKMRVKKKLKSKVEDDLQGDTNDKDEKEQNKK